MCLIILWFADIFNSLEKSINVKHITEYSVVSLSVPFQRKIPLADTRFDSVVNESLPK